MAKKKALPTRSKDVPATLGMLHLVRDELKSEMAAGFLELKSEMTSGFLELKSGFLGLKSEMAKMSSSMHQMKLLVEEQRAENRIVMDGLTSLFDRQDRVEKRLDAIEKP